MVSDELYTECVKILSDKTLLEEEQTEKVEALLSLKTDLKGSALETKVLDVLWRYKEGGTASTLSSSPPPTRPTIIRRASPAPWQNVGAFGSPVGTPPAVPPPGFPTALMHGSPFPSPRPSPLLSYASPRIPHSPSLNAYESAMEAESMPSDYYGDLGSESVDWLVADDESSNYLGVKDGLMQQETMSPHDMLRSVLGVARTDEELELALESSGYDLSSTISMLMEQEMMAAQEGLGNSGIGLVLNDAVTIVSGKSATTYNPPNDVQRSPGRPTTPRSGVICRFFLSTGSCLRADCKFSHDLSSTICKYWLNGSCLAGDTCIFSHDPTLSANRATTEHNRFVESSPPFQYQEATFPSLLSDQWSPTNNNHGSNANITLSPPPGFRPLAMHRQNSRGRRSPSPSMMAPSVDDTEAFPTLGSFKSGKKNQNRRNRNNNNNNNHNHNNNDYFGSPRGAPTGPSSLADVIRMSPSPGSHGKARYNQVATSPTPSYAIPVKGRNINGKTPISAAAAAIPAPQQIPWLDTGNAMNKTYLKHRHTAIKHGQLRNKYLSAAAAAWSRNDAKAAKNLSIKGQQEQAEMRKAHREAAAAIYEQRQKAANKGLGTELFIDLHGLHPEEAVEYLERVLIENQNSSQPLYVITGTGHHSKNGKDKVQRAIRSFLDEWRYVYREFSAQGDRGGMGGILGIDPKSFDRKLLEGGAGSGSAGAGGRHPGAGSETDNDSGMDVNSLALALDDDTPLNADGEMPRSEVELVVKLKESRKKTTPPLPTVVTVLPKVSIEGVEGVVDSAI